MAKQEKDFFKLSAEEQAREIERQTKKLVARLPDLKKNLKMYGEVSDELYNLDAEEVATIGSTYARAVRGGEISTPSSKRAYQKFINDMRKYTHRSIGDIAKETANKRMESFMEHIRKYSKNPEEVEKAEQLYAMMNDSDKLGFTRSKLFLDVEDWGSDQFQKFIQDYEYSISFVKWQEYLVQRGYNIEEVYKRKG